jgi:DNA invertase Pin-like site-specific DNA recombinase
MMKQMERLGLHLMNWANKNLNVISSQTMEAPRVAAYLRSATKEDDSVAHQLAEIEQYVGDHGWELAGTYVDNGYSGNSDRRPALLRLRQDIRDGQVDMVITRDRARLFRNIAGLIAFQCFVQEHQTELIYLQDIPGYSQQMF